MAKSSSTGFIFKKTIYGSEAPAALEFRLGDSATITVGDAVRLNTSGLAVLVGLGVPVLGIVVGIVDNNGINPFSNGYSNGTGGTLTGDDTVTTASDNSSRASYLVAQVLVDPSGSLLFYNDADDTMAQTNVGQFYDILAASDQVDESSASDTSGQVQLISLDPDGDGDASKGLFRIVESQLYSAPSNSTTIIGA